MTRRPLSIRAARAPAALLLALAAAWPVGAQAGLFDDEEARKAIVELRGRLERTQQENSERDARQRELAEQVETLKRSLLDLNAQIESLRADLAKLRGQDEQQVQSGKDLAREIAELQRKLKDQFAAIDERMRRLEPQRVSLDGRDAVVEAPEKKAYDEAIGILRKGEFANAAAALTSFQKRFPSSPYQGHVQYWLGNAYYASHDCKKAIDAHKVVLAKWPQHQKAPDSLINIATCQQELGDAKGAKATYESVLSKYPGTPAATTAKQRLKK